MISLRKLIYIPLVFLCSWSLSLAADAPESILNKIKQRQELMVCISVDYFGITYRDPKTGLISGIDNDMAQAFAKDLGVRLSFVESSYSGLYKDIDENRCDIAMFGLGVTEERATKLRLSQPYLISETYAIVSKSNRRIKSWSDIDQPGVVIVAIRGTTHETNLRARLKLATLNTTGTGLEREAEVLSGRADAFMTDYPYSQNFLRRANWARRIAPEGNFARTPYVYVTKRGDEVWAQRVDQFVSAIKSDGRLRASAEHHGLSAILFED
jgi:ABC-type amino acid transport substrate-binding protein